MAFKKPESVEECVYFTNRIIGDGRATAWVFRKECPKCRGIMGKPQKKNGKIDKKADHYACYSCGYKEGNEKAENSLLINVEYKCPHCGNEGETTTEYQRKSFEGVPSYVFECQKCKKKIGLTKKLKETKKKKSEDNADGE
jgi:DNA-directed RNA polymerase subunit M/transcription elongation factor TFIIS